MLAIFCDNFSRTYFVGYIEMSRLDPFRIPFFWELGCCADTHNECFLGLIVFLTFPKKRDFLQWCACKSLFLMTFKTRLINLWKNFYKLLFEFSWYVLYTSTKYTLLNFRWVYGRKWIKLWILQFWNHDKYMEVPKTLILA